jgi:hypothetical protein
VHVSIPDVNLSINDSSPPTLTSSPPLISEIDTNSLHSMGCESGIVLRESVERDETSKSYDCSERFSSISRDIPTGKEANKSPSVTPPAHSLPIDFSSLTDVNEMEGESESTTPPAFSSIADRAAMVKRTRKTSTSTTRKQCNADVVETQGNGAFRPVARRRTRRTSQSNPNIVDVETNEGKNSPRTVQSPANVIGEKRRRQISTHLDAEMQKMEGALEDDGAREGSPVASRTRSTRSAADSASELQRSMLTARRTRVRVLYHDACPQTAGKGNSTTAMPCDSANGNSLAFGESPPNIPLRKRGRHSAADRPSLNFDKMRERMMGGSA